jgi:hypothetical protein
MKVGSSSDLGDTGLLVFVAEVTGSWTGRFQMIEVVVSVVLWGSFFDIFFGGGLDELDGFLVFTQGSVAKFAGTVRVTAIALVTSVTRVMTSITPTQPIHKRGALTAFL